LEDTRKKLINGIISIAIGVVAGSAFGSYFFEGVLDKEFDFSTDYSFVLVDLAMFILGLVLIIWGIIIILRRNKITKK